MELRDIHGGALNQLPTTEPGWRQFASGRDAVLHQHGRILVASYQVDMASDDFHFRENQTHFRLDYRLSAEGMQLRTGTLEEKYQST